MIDPNQRMLDECEAALASVKDRITAKLYQDVGHMIGAGECDLALEILISNLSELDIEVTAEQFAIIERAVMFMGIASDTELEYLQIHGLE